MPEQLQCFVVFPVLDYHINFPSVRIISRDDKHHTIDWMQRKLYFSLHNCSIVWYWESLTLQ